MTPQLGNLLQELANAGRPGVIGLRRPRLDDQRQAVNPFVTVILPVRNGASFIADAIESVLNQTYTHRELIVVDDGSTDETRLIVSGFGSKVRLICQDNRGHAAARNAGALEASGDWIAMIDADDLWDRHKLQTQVANCKDVDVVYTAARNFEDSQRVENVTFHDRNCPSGDVFDELLLDNFITHSSVLIRRDAFLAAGGYDESLRTTCDWDLWLRMAALGCLFEGIRNPLTHYRWRAGSNSKNHQKTCEDRLLVVMRALQTMRGEQVPVLHRNKAVARVWQTSAWFAAESDDRTALEWYIHSILWRPYSVRGWKEVFRCCLHLCGIRRAKIADAVARVGFRTGTRVG